MNSRTARRIRRRVRARLHIIAGGPEHDPAACLAVPGRARLRVVQGQLRIRPRRPHPFPPGGRAA